MCTLRNQSLSHALERASRRRVISNLKPWAAVTVEGTSGQQTGIACGGTEVPMELAREFLRAVA